MVSGTRVPQGTRLNPRNTFEVCEGMLVQAAINAAAAQVPAPSATNPWTILIYPGIYNETIVGASWVNLRGIGPKGSVIIQQTDLNTVLLATNMEISGLTLRIVTPTAARVLIRDADVACTVKMMDLVFEITTPVALDHIVFNFTGAGVYTIERCSYNIGGTGAAFGVRNVSNAATIHLADNDFQFTNINAFHIASNQNGTWTGRGNRWTGTCGMFSVSDGRITLDGDAMICTGVWVVTNSIIGLRHCAIEAPVVTGGGGNVRMKDCSYRAIQRGGAEGNIVDESSQLQDYPWHVVKWNWMTALANADVAVRGTPVDAGSGQIMLEVTDNAPDAEAVEAELAAAGSLSNKITPQRTPRFITQISVDSFDPHVTMFFGLRETLGNAIPGGAEHSIGFDWDGTNFRAVNCNALGQTATNLDIPGTDALHQLECICIYGTMIGCVYYVDGIFVAAHTTKLPNQPLDWQHLLATAGAGGGDVIRVTIRNGGVQECPN